MLSPSSALKYARLGGAVLLRRGRHKRYIADASGILWRELDLPGDFARFEHAVRRADRWMRRQHPGFSIDRLVLSRDPVDRFDEGIGRMGEELGRILAREYPGSRAEDNDHIAARWRRAVRAAIARSDDDAVAHEILARYEPATDTRRNWQVVTACVVLPCAAGVLASLGVQEAVDRPIADVLTGLGTAAAFGSAGLAALAVTQGHLLSDARVALRCLLDALLSPNVPDYRVLTLPERLREPPLAPVVVRELQRVHRLLGSGAPGVRGPPGGELVNRWDGAERATLRSANEVVADAFRRIPALREWQPVEGVVAGVERLLAGAGAGRDQPYESELSAGSVLYEVLARCAVVANQLDAALDRQAAEGQRAA